MSQEIKLPEPDTHCLDDDSQPPKDVWSYSPELVWKIIEADRAQRGEPDDDYCQKCGNKWVDHDFGVPKPPCPPSQQERRPSRQWYERMIQDTLDDDFVIGPAFDADRAQRGEPDKYDSTGAMAAAWFGTTGAEKAVNAVFPSQPERKHTEADVQEILSLNLHYYSYEEVLEGVVRRILGVPKP